MGTVGRAFALGFASALALAGCAAMKFPYHWYGLQPFSYDGTLLGPEPKDDLPLSDCAPEPRPSPGPSPGPPANGRCVVLKSEVFLKLRTDFLELEQRLSDCEAKP